MSRQVVFRRLLVIVLNVTCVVIICKSIDKYLSEETTFIEEYVDEQVYFPDVSVCRKPHRNPLYNEEPEITTFEEVQAQINVTQFEYFGYLLLEEKFKKLDAVLLADSNELKKTFNKTMQDVWSFYPKTDATSPYRTVICALIKSPLREVPNNKMVDLEFYSKDWKAHLLLVHLHEPGHYRFHYILDPTKDEESFVYRQTFIFKDLQQITTQRLKKAQHDCHDDNSMKLGECIDEYYAMKLNCLLPWNFHLPKKAGRKLCSGNDTFARYKALSMSFNSPDIQAELKDFGCLKPNCRTTQWKAFPQSSIPTKQNITGASHSFREGSQVLLRREVKLYSFESFIGDCGGYLGLLLGESLLSFFDRISFLLFRRFSPFKVNSNPLLPALP